MTTGRVEALDRSPFGLNIHTAARLVPLFAGIGIRWCRVDFDWDRIEASPGRFEWDETDRLVEAADEHGLSVLAGAGYTPPWASDADRRENLDPEAVRGVPPLSPEPLRRFLREVLTRYQGRLHAISVWNEPDFIRFWRGTLEEYLALLTAALMAVRETAPEVVTCGPDLSGWERGRWWHLFKPSRERAWMKRILAATDRGDRGGPLLDVITHHQYGGDDIPEKRVALIEDLHRFVSSRSSEPRPLWITETGWATDKVPSLAKQADHLRTTMAAMTARRSWWHKTFWYDSHGREGRAEWGLIGPEGAPDAEKPRPAFFAYQAVIAESGVPLPVRKAEAVRKVEAAYQAILGRPADAEGRAVHVRLLRLRSTVDVCEALLSSAEFSQRLNRVGLDEIVAQFFKGASGQVPSTDQQEAARRALNDGRAAQFVAALIDAPARTA